MKDANRVPTESDQQKEKKVKDLLREARAWAFEEETGQEIPREKPEENESALFLPGEKAAMLEDDPLLDINTNVLQAASHITNAIVQKKDTLVTSLREVTPDAPESQHTLVTAVTGSLKYTLLNRSFDEVYNATFEPMTQIYGSIYEPAKRLSMYIGLANALKRNMIEDVFYHDMRISAWFCLPSGAGKREIKKAILLSELPGIHNFIAPTSYHSEHFVGKITPSKEKADKGKLINHSGYLEEDLIIIDEAKELFCDPTFANGRKYLRVAQDPIGRNEVVKATSDTPEKFRKRFISPAVIVAFFQPGKYPDDIAQSGDLRRNIICYFAVPHEVKIQIMEEKIATERPNPQIFRERIDDWHNILYTLKAQTFKWDLSTIKKEIIAYGEQFYQYASYRGEFATEIAEHAYVDAQLHLTRFAICRAAIEGKSKIEKKHLDAAYEDFYIFYKQYLDFVIDSLLGDWIKIAGKKLPEADLDRMHVAVLWLAEQGALSPLLSQISPTELLAWMSTQGWGAAKRGNTGPYRIYKLMKKFGYVEFSRMRTGARIWLCEDKLWPAWKDEVRGTLRSK